MLQEYGIKTDFCSGDNMVKILRGKALADALSTEISTRANALREKGKIPTLAIVRLGERPDDLAYERGASKRAEKIGVDIRKITFPADTTQNELLLAIDEINRDYSVDGVLLFRPLPNHIDDDAVRNALDPDKDMDGITDISQAGVYAGVQKGYPPCTAEACMELLRFYDYDMDGKNVAVIGRSQVIGKPVALMLIKENATVTVCHTKTLNIADICHDKDIVIAAAGHINTVTKSFMSSGQVIIDVAINFDSEGNMRGDVDFESASKIVEAITPVPGGVGGVTTTILMKHCIEAAEKKAVGGYR